MPEIISSDSLKPFEQEQFWSNIAVFFKPPVQNHGKIQTSKFSQQTLSTLKQLAIILNDKSIFLMGWILSILNIVIHFSIIKWCTDIIIQQSCNNVIVLMAPLCLETWSSQCSIRLGLWRIHYKMLKASFWHSKCSPLYLFTWLFFTFIKAAPNCRVTIIC